LFRENEYKKLPSLRSAINYLSPEQAQGLSPRNC